MTVTPDNRVTMFIPFRDRCSYLKRLLTWASNGESLIKKIVIFDMETSYKPALKYLRSLAEKGTVGPRRVPVRVHYVENSGARSIFSGGSTTTLARREVCPNERFILTDPDVLPTLEENKAFLVNAMHRVLDVCRGAAKAGCSLKIDDLPDHFPQKNQVIRWEKRFWKTKATEVTHLSCDLYHAEIATTFAMYRRFDAVSKTADGPSMRLGEPFGARHLPWYEDPNKLPPDVKHYYKHAPMRRWGTPGPGISWSPLQGPNR